MREDFCRYNSYINFGGAIMKWITGAVVVSLAFFGGAMIFSQGAAADQGKAVFAAQKCSMCHSIAGAGGDKALDGVGARLKPDEIRKRLISPKGVKPDSAMKAYPNLPEKDIGNLIAYLQTLK
jgi:mono/diheme cytochrome c family protein